MAEQFDKRVMVLRSGSKITVFGRTFDSVSDAVAYSDEVIARRERYAGRKLSGAELLHGIAHAEDRDERTRLRDSQFAPVGSQPTAEPTNPFDEPLANGGRYDRTRETRKQMYERAAKEWEANHAPVEEIIDEKRQRAIALAEQALEKAMFSPVPMSELVRAQQMRAQAEADIEAFASMYSDYSTRERERISNLRDEIQQRLDSIGDEPEPLEAPKPAQRVYFPPENKSAEAEAWRAANGH